MLTWLENFEDALARAETLDSRLETARKHLARFGFTAAIYDYSPVPLTHDGNLITPNVLKLRNVEANMADLWCRRGYYQIDPVQSIAARISRPFAWSYASSGDAALAAVIQPRHEPVVQYLRDTRMTCGVTVPLHLPDGGFATFTGICIDPEPDFQAEARRNLASVALIGGFFHDTAFTLLDQSERTCRYVKLTGRERECLRLTAQGLTAKEVAFRLGRSQATVNMHLNAAIRKLGARNRTQAVARATHYRLLEAVADRDATYDFC